MKFQNKSVLITGACSGIGKIMARKVLERGARVLTILDINPTLFEDLKNEWLHFGAEIHFYQIDLSDLQQIQEISSKVKEEVGMIDVLINNAGVVTGAYFHEHSHKNISLSMGVNSNAPMHLTLEFINDMIERNSGAICTICSSAGLISNPRMSVYAASKWAVVGWSDSLRLEMEQLKKKISVTTIMPFYINTGMFEGVKSKMLPILEPEPTAEKIIRAVEKETKMLAMPLPYWFIRLSQGILPLGAFDWVMKNVFGIYDTMKDFTGRKYKN